MGVIMIDTAATKVTLADVTAVDSTAPVRHPAIVGDSVRLAAFWLPDCVPLTGTS